jgi:molecular chaperone DnaJ
VQIPRKVRPGEQVNFEGLGSQGLGKWGDLIATIKEKVAAQGSLDARQEVSIAIAEAVLGCTKRVSTALGSKEIVVEPGSCDGTVIILEGQGHQHKDRKKAGDMEITLRIRIPKKLTSEQKRFYESELSK